MFDCASFWEELPPLTGQGISLPDELPMASTVGAIRPRNAGGASVNAYSQHGGLFRSEMAEVSERTKAARGVLWAEGAAPTGGKASSSIALAPQRTSPRMRGWGSCGGLSLGASAGLSFAPRVPYRSAPAERAGGHPARGPARWDRRFILFANEGILLGRRRVFLLPSTPKEG